MQKSINRKLIVIAVAFVGIVLVAMQLFGASGLFDFTVVPLSTLLVFGAIAVTLQMIAHWLRAVKHRYLLEQIRPIRTAEVFKGQMIGFVFNTILPFRLGELVRAHYIGRGVAISRSAVFATILFERWCDTILLLLIAGLLLATLLITNATLIYVTSIMFVTAIVLGYLLYAARTQQRWILRLVHRFSGLLNKRLRDRIRFIAWSGIYCLKNVITKDRLNAYVALTILMWVFYLLAVLVMVMSILPGLPIVHQFLTAAAAYFGVAVPSGPAYLGTFQETFSAISNLPGSLAAHAYAPFILWLLLIAPTTLLGFVLLLPRQKVYSAKDATVLDVLKNKLYRDADITREFSHFLDAYFKGDEINRILTAEELAGNFRVIKTFKGASNALTILAWQNEQMVVKKIILKQYESKLSDQYTWLKTYSKFPQVAKVLQEHHNNDHHYAIDIEYREEYIPFFDFIHSSSVAESKKILHNVCRFVDEKIHTPQKPLKNPRRVVQEYIKTKAIGKITDAANSNLAIAHLLTYDKLIVNGRELENFPQVMERLSNHKAAMADLAEVIDCPIQGDFTVDNIIVNPATSEFIILDPNNENAISDPVVDYGKLLQSVHSGYEFLISLATCSVNDNQVNFEERRSVQYSKLYAELRNDLQEQLTPGRYRALLFHEAVHYTRMLTYKVSINPQTAPAFYCIAVRLLNDFMDQYDSETKV